MHARKHARPRDPPKENPAFCAGFFGAGNRNRTYDPIITNDVLYQLSYSGVGAILAGAGGSIHQAQAQFLGEGEHHVFRLAM